MSANDGLNHQSAGCDHRIGGVGVWRKVRECLDADGNRVVIAKIEGGIDETDFGKTEWLNMPPKVLTNDL